MFLFEWNTNPPTGFLVKNCSACTMPWRDIILLVHRGEIKPLIIHYSRIVKKKKHHHENKMWFLPFKTREKQMKNLDKKKVLN